MCTERAEIFQKFFAEILQRVCRVYCRNILNSFCWDSAEILQWYCKEFAERLEISFRRFLKRYAESLQRVCRHSSDSICRDIAAIVSDAYCRDIAENYRYMLDGSAEIVWRVSRDASDILIFGQSLQRYCIEAAADRDHGCWTVLGCLQFG